MTKENFKLTNFSLVCLLDRFQPLPIVSINQDKFVYTIERKKYTFFSMVATSKRK